jgi:hypothetical protein
MADVLNSDSSATSGLDLLVCIVDLGFMFKWLVCQRGH